MSAQAFHEIGLLELPRPDVDADPHPQPLRMPHGHLRQRGVYDPLAHVDRQGMVLDRGQKQARGQQAPVGVLPADERLGPHHLVGHHVDLGLVVQHKLVLRQGTLNLVHTLALRLDGRVRLHIEHVVTVFAGLFGQVHGLVGMAQQQIGVGIVLREQGHANAGRHLQGRASHLCNRSRCCMQQALQHGLAVRGLGQVHEHHHKLVTPHACQRIAFAQRFFHAFRQSHQQLVTHVVPVHVVHGLESVQIEVGHGQ